MNIGKLLDDAKNVTSITSDRALAKRLGLSPAAISNYRTGVSLPDTVTCAKIAEITGLPLARVLGIVGEARAISAAEKAVWRKLAQAAMVLVAISPAIASAAETAASNIQHPFSAIMGGFLVIFIMSEDGQIHIYMIPTEIFQNRSSHKNHMGGLRAFMQAWSHSLHHPASIPAAKA